jgi:hypothetical protein
VQVAGPMACLPGIDAGARLSTQHACRYPLERPAQVPVSR